MVARRVTFFVVIVLPIPIINLFSPSRCALHLAGFSLLDPSATNIHSFRLGGYLMTKNPKRRAWTPTQVRTLKTLARKKTHVIWPRMDNAGYPQFCSAAKPSSPT